MVDFKVEEPSPGAITDDPYREEPAPIEAQEPAVKEEEEEKEAPPKPCFDPPRTARAAEIAGPKHLERDAWADEDDDPRIQDAEFVPEAVEDVEALEADEVDETEEADAVEAIFAPPQLFAEVVARAEVVDTMIDDDGEEMLVVADEVEEELEAEATWKRFAANVLDLRPRLMRVDGDIAGRSAPRIELADVVSTARLEPIEVEIVEEIDDARIVGQLAADVTPDDELEAAFEAAVEAHSLDDHVVEAEAPIEVVELEAEIVAENVGRARGRRVSETMWFMSGYAPGGASGDENEFLDLDLLNAKYSRRVYVPDNVRKRYSLDDARPADADE